MANIPEGHVIVNAADLEEAFNERDQALRAKALLEVKCSDQKVLINQSAKVVDVISKIWPGLFKGEGIASLDISKLMDGKSTKALEPECMKLFELMEEYKKTNPIIL